MFNATSARQDLHALALVLAFPANQSAVGATAYEHISLVASNPKVKPIAFRTSNAANGTTTYIGDVPGVPFSRMAASTSGAPRPTPAWWKPW